MNKILIAGAGGAPTEGVIFSLLKEPLNNSPIYCDNSRIDHFLAQ